LSADIPLSKLSHLPTPRVRVGEQKCYMKKQERKGR
jgi:hypothetical protein